MMKCHYCNCETITKVCDICGKNVDEECVECHLEIAHGIIISGYNKPCCGNTKGYPEEDAKYFPGIPSNKWR